MKIFKKSMCLLLAVVMVLGMAITASAVETTETMSVTASKANPAVGEEFSIYLNASGNIAARRQDIAAGTEVPVGTVIDVEFSDLNQTSQ